MEEQSDLEPVEFEKAICDPAAVYAAPEDVVADKRLTVSEKLEILRRWAHDADRLAVAESEGMGGGEPAMQRRVLESLREIEQQIAEHAQPGERAPRPGNRLGRE